MASKKEIKNILKDNLQSGKHIHGIISVLKEHLKRDLDIMEDYYVKYKCLKYCLEFWVEKCTTILLDVDPEFLSEYLEIINNLTPKALQPGHFPSELKLLTMTKSFKILEDFCSNYIPVDARQERSIILETFKSKIWNNVLESVEEYKDAREYLESFQALLTECGISKKELISGLKLENMGSPLDEDDLIILKTALEKLQQKYEHEHGPTYKVISNILSLHNNLMGTKSLVDSEKLIVKNKLGIRFQYFVKPPKISLEQDVLTVCGCALTIAEVYPEIIKNLLNVKVKEVHLYSPDVIVVDQSLEGEAFQGVNLVLSTTKLIVSSSHVWDFSGKPGQSAFSGQPPKAINPIQNGLDGEDGSPGESGGNVHILVSNIIGNGNAMLHIRSNGGDGGNGRGGGDGGDGIDGDDGDKHTAIDEDKFRAMIPKVSLFNYKASNKNQLKCYEALIEIMDAENGYQKENKSEYKSTGEKWVYQSIVTAAGAEAGFSIYEGPILSNAYGFYAWYFGAPGTEGSVGGHGGRGGRGGSGGYAGEIEIQLSNKNLGGGGPSKGGSPRTSTQLALITVEKSDGNPGRTGNSGKPGNPGKPGKKGTDYACVHPFSTIHGRTFYKGSLIKRLHASKTEPSPWCEYAKTKIHFENSQREITRLKNEHKRFELKARTAVKTSQKQRTILKSNTEREFEQHCRRYFLNVEFQDNFGKLSQHSITSTTVYQALQTLQYAARICDFNPREPIVPPRKRKLGTQADKQAAFKAGYGSSLSLSRSMPDITMPPLLKLLETLNQQSPKDEDESPEDKRNFLQLSKKIEQAVHGSEDKTSLSLSVCQELSSSIQQSENLTANMLRVKQAIEQNLRYKSLALIDSQIQQLPEVKLGKIRKLDPNFYLVFIKNGGQLENNFQSSNFHSQIAAEIELFLRNDTEKDADISSQSHLFVQYKSSMVEKGLEKFTAFMQYLNKYTKKHLKKLSKNSDSRNSEEEANMRLTTNRKSSFQGPNRLPLLEKFFIQGYLQKEGIGAEHYHKLLPSLSTKVDKWLLKIQVLEEYAKFLSKGPISGEDFDVLATVYRVTIHVFRQDSTNNPDPQLRYSAQPICFSNQDALIPLQNNNTTTIKLIETEVNFAPLATTSTIAKQQAQVYLEILNDTARPEFFEEFDLQERLQAIDRCFLNRRFTLSKLVQSSAPNDIDELTERLSTLLPEASRIVQLAILSSVRFDNRLISALVERLTWQGLNLPAFMFVELGLSILNGDEVDMLHLEWILTSLPKSRWVLEIVLIMLQQFFTNNNQDIHQYEVQQWKQNLSKMDQMGLILLAEKCAAYYHDCRGSMIDESYQNARLVTTLHQISSIISETELATVEIYEELLNIRLQDWPKQLTNIKIRKTLKLLNSKWAENEEDEDFKKCIYYASSLHNEYPTFIDECLRILRRAKENHPRTEIEAAKLVEIFSNYYHGYWSIPTNELIENFDSFEYFYTVLAHQNDSKIQKGERQRDEILKFISHDKNTTLGSLAINRIRFELRYEPKSGVGFLDPDVPVKEALKKWGQKVRQCKSSHELPSIGEMIYCINTAIYQCKKFSLRDTQKVTLVTMLEEEQRNILAQVATGEGKSLIVVAWAIVKCLQGGKCDVITSSSILAERDALENKDVFDIFQISVAHNSSCDIEARKEAYKKDVVYGDVANFQRDFLLNKYYETNILGERSALENVSVMVDEVDSMLLDKGNSVLYLSHKPAGVEALNALFIFIWKTMNLNSNPDEPVTYDLVRKTILSEIYTIITPSMLKCLDYAEPGIGESIHGALHESGYLSADDRYISRDHNKPPMPDNLIPYSTALWYIIKSEEARKREFGIPKHLEEFVNLHLDTWISNAFRALELIPGKEYIVDTTSKSYATPDKDPKVIIVDKDTGEDLSQSQWNNGLHQFLQLKHQCSFSNLSLKAIFISNISYFRKYGSIHGLTGTLGSEIERTFLKKTYSVEFVNIPTATPKKFVEELPIVAGTLDEWRDKIVGKACELVNGERKRSVLVICESINDADFLHQGLVDRARKRNSRLSMENIHIYKRSYEKFSFLSESDTELQAGQIIISTNLAGRGTDIKISKELNENGGLCVILSYLPNNIRVEQQAFGRGARKGQNGSGILIVLNRELSATTGSTESTSDEVTMVDLKNDRDESEIFTMSQIETEFESIIGYEESLFDHFSRHFQIIKPKIKDIYNKSKIQGVVQYALLDKWAFWLDKVVIKKLPHEEAVISLEKLVQDFLFENEDAPNLLDILDSPTHLVSIGKLYLDKSMWSLILGTLWTDNTYAENSLPFFNKAIAMLGPNSSHHTIPLYYKAFAQILQSDEFDQNSKSAVKALLRSVERGFRSLIAEECSHVSVVSSISERLHQTQSFIQVESFKDQRRNIISVYQLFIDSIHNILGPILLPDHFQTQNINTQDQILELLAQLSSAHLIRNCSVVDLPPCNNSAVPSGVTNRLLYKCINPDIKLVEEIATAYGVRASELHEVVFALRQECDHKFDISNEEIKEFFDFRLRLPNRKDFWDALVKSKVISEPKTVAIISDFSASTLCATTVFKNLQKQTRVGDILGLDVKDQVFYSSLPLATNHIASRYPAFSIHMSYTDAMKNEDLYHLQRQGLIHINQYGKWVGENVDKITTELEYGCSYLLKFEYALMLLAERGIPVDLLDYNIFYYLIEQRLINSQGLLLHTKFDEVDWGKYAFFKDELISVIQLQCIYRVYVLYLQNEMSLDQCEAVDISFLNSDSSSALVNELFHSGILRRYRITSQPTTTISTTDAEKKEIVPIHFRSALENFSTLTMNDIKAFFTRVNISLQSVEAFWFHLISKDWLRAKGVGYEDEIPKEGKLHLPKNFKPKDLEEPWNSPEIVNFLTVRSSLIHERQTILRSLEQFTSRLNQIQEPDGVLQKIENMLGKQQRQKLASEIMMVQSMGLDSVMTIFDKNWSLSKRESSACTHSSNYLQIAAGIAISVYSVGFGAFSGQLLIDQGIADICLSLTNMFIEQLALEEYWTRQTSPTAALISLISPAVSMYLLGTGYQGHIGYKIVSSSAASGKSSWLRLATSAGHQIGQEVIKVVLSETYFATEALSIEQKIKSKYFELVEEIEAKISKQVEDFMNSDAVVNLCQRIGNDEARSELILTLNQENFGVKEWLQIESLVQNYADNKLEWVRNSTFEKKNSTSKYQTYLKHVEKFFKMNKDGKGKSEDLVGDLWQPIHLLLNQCMKSINSMQSSEPSKKPDHKYKQAFLVFELGNILTKRVEEMLYQFLLFPVCNTITDNFLRDADASLMRQLSKSRKNLVKSFISKDSVKRSFLAKGGEDAMQDSDCLDYDRIEELRLKRLCTKLFKLEQKCADPYLLSEFVRAELSCGQILLQACANCYNCKIILREMEGLRPVKMTEVTPANPKQGEDQKCISVDISAQQSLYPDADCKITAAQFLQIKEQSQRKFLDCLIIKLKKAGLTDSEITRDELRHKLADVIKSDVGILMSLRNMRMNMNK